MEFLNEIGRHALNWWAVAAATVAGFAVGGLWYSPLLFARAWMKEMGLSEADIRKDDMVRIMGTAFVLTAVLAYGIARLAQRWAGFEGGLKVGVLVGVLVAAVLGTNALYERRSLRLWAINAGHWLATCLVIGAIVGAWR